MSKTNKTVVLPEINISRRRRFHDDQGRSVSHLPRPPPPRDVVAIRAESNAFLSEHDSILKATQELETFSASLFRDVLLVTRDEAPPNPMRTAVMMFLLERLFEIIGPRAPSFLKGVIGDIFKAVYLPNTPQVIELIGNNILTSQSQQHIVPHPMVQPYARKTFFEATEEIARRIKAQNYTLHNAQLFAKKQGQRIVAAIESWSAHTTAKCFRAWRSHVCSRKQLILRARHYLVRQQFRESVRTNIRNWIAFSQRRRMQVVTDTAKQLTTVQEAVEDMRIDTNELARTLAGQRRQLEDLTTVHSNLRDTFKEMELECQRLDDIKKQNIIALEETCRALYNVKEVCSYRAEVPKTLIKWAEEMMAKSHSKLSGLSNSIAQAAALHPAPFDATNLASVLCGAFPNIVTSKDVLATYKNDGLFHRAEAFIALMKPFLCDVDSLVTPQQIAQGEPEILTLLLSIMLYKYAEERGGTPVEQEKWQNFANQKMSKCAAQLLETLRTRESAAASVSSASSPLSGNSGGNINQRFSELSFLNLKDVLPENPREAGTNFEKWRKAILTRTTLLGQVFDSHATWDPTGQQRKVVTAASFWRLVKEASLLDLLPRSMLNNLLMVTTNDGTAALTPSKFSELMIRVAVRAAVPLETLLDDNISRAGKGMQDSPLAGVLGDIRIRNALTEHHDDLYRLYSKYSIHNPKSETHELREDSFLDLCSRCKWEDDVLTLPRLRKVYAHMLVGAYTSLDFQEFADAVVAVAMYRNPNPYVEPVDKLVQLITQTIIPNCAI